MKSNWKAIKLNDAVVINPKETIPRDAIRDCITMDSVIPWTRKVETIKKEHYKGGAKFRNGDTLMARITPCLENGKCCFVSGLEDEIGFGSTEFLVFRAKNGITIPKFVYYLVRCPFFFNNAIKSMTGTSGRQRVQTDVLRDMEVLIPTVKEQAKIVSILDGLETKIELNNAINKNLLEQAISIFNWFYDSSTHQQPFSSVINVFGGGTPKTSDPNFWNGDIPFFTPKDVGNPYTFKTEKYITDDGLAKCNSRLYPTNTTFVTARGTVGKVSLAGVPMAMNQSCYALVSDTLDPILVYFYTLKVVSSLKHKASGAVFDAIVTRDFDNEMINILSDTDAQQLLEVVTPMFAAIHNNDAECLRLSALRDAILPKLLSGELAFEAN